MSVWDANDKNGYTSCLLKGVGQITLNSEFGQLIYKITQDNNLKTFLEIGTWNGLGSTKCFIEGFKNRKTDFSFYSLECNSEKSKIAHNMYKNIENVHILNEVIYHNDPDNFFDIFPECKKDSSYKIWHNIDMQNMKNCKLFLDRNNLPQIFDVLLLDGGEFTTYYEFQALKDRCKLLLLDDINTAKCKKNSRRNKRK